MADAGSGDGGRPGRSSLLPQVSWRLWNLKPPEWRTAGWLGALLVAGLLLLATRPAAGGHTGLPSRTASPPAATPSDPLQADEQSLETNLQAALDGIAGAGTVTVRVHLQAGPVTDYAFNTQETESTSSGSGAQTTTQQSESSQLAAGAQGGAPAVQSVQAPAITGVLVVAQGGADPAVRAELSAAVQAATGVPLYEIVVLPAAAGAATGSAAG